VAKRLIVNADDYGRSPEISRGIREAHLQGVVTSSTCMMNIPTTADDISVALMETPKLGLGVHLVLTMGRPLSAPEAVSSLVNAGDAFYKYEAFIENIPNIKMDEVRAEWRSQIDKFVKVAGRKPTHLDSHHHSSFFSVELFRGMLELAREYDCAIRYPFMDGAEQEFEEAAKHVSEFLKDFSPRRPDTFIATFYDVDATQEALFGIINRLKDGTTEIMCHPGHVDDSFAKESTYNFQRERELNILIDPAVRNAIDANGIELISFAEI